MSTEETPEGASCTQCGAWIHCETRSLDRAEERKPQPSRVPLVILAHSPVYADDLRVVLPLGIFFIGIAIIVAIWLVMQVV